ncbi:hypothetical protein B0T17DRAFT_507324 [Bombardia bombarda]|uniref:Fungal N-terminal domain-containing protein n=1 Tax=Bombardia bombarda TaxID=252184 RepID=A0AA40C9W8_9PEZI|nr:hypothetical protein B0T17DRAFT_507324 [Bombardia bombarda]
MEGVSAASAIVGLIDVAFSVMHAIRKATNRINGDSKTLGALSSELNSIEQILEGVREEVHLQTTKVYQAVANLNRVGEELQGFFQNLERKQGTPKTRRFLHALKDGDKEDQDFQRIMGCLSGAKANLMLQIQITGVGVTANQIAGLNVKYQTLARVNARMAQMTGTGLVMNRVLEERNLIPRSPGDGETIHLEADDVVAIENAIQFHIASSSGTERFTTRNLKTGDNFKMHEGDVGFDTPNTVGQRSVMENIKFGDHGRVTRGNISKEVNRQSHSVTVEVGGAESTMCCRVQRRVGGISVLPPSETEGVIQPDRRGGMHRKAPRSMGWTTGADHFLPLQSMRASEGLMQSRPSQCDQKCDQKCDPKAEGTLSFLPSLSHSRVWNR